MADVCLDIGNPINRLTLKVMLERDGHAIAAGTADVLITDDLRSAVDSAARVPTLVLVDVAHVPDAVEAMRKGVFGYILLPFEPGEADIMVRRAMSASTAPDVADTPVLSLAEAERRHILDTLRRCSYNRAEAARLLRIGRNTLWRKLRQYGEGDG
jgi:DNA-binding NtrC family response regulator